MTSCERQRYIVWSVQHYFTVLPACSCRLVAASGQIVMSKCYGIFGLNGNNMG